MTAPTGSGRAGASRFQLSHQNGATHRKNASIWCETTGGRHRLLNEINRLQPRQPWHAPCNNADDLPAGQPAMSIENIEKLKKGSASCRERERTSASISEVALELKKKKK